MTLTDDAVKAAVVPIIGIYWTGVVAVDCVAILPDLTASINDLAACEPSSTLRD